MNKWQSLTQHKISAEFLSELEPYCSEFLIHAADVEGLCRGIDHELVAHLGCITNIPTTYAGGARSLDDIELVDRLGKGKIDLTYGSALDIFGGKVPLVKLVEWNKTKRKDSI